METVKSQIDDKQKQILQNQKDAKNIDKAIDEMSKKLDVVNYNFKVYYNFHWNIQS